MQIFELFRKRGIEVSKGGDPPKLRYDTLVGGKNVPRVYKVALTAVGAATAGDGGEVLSWENPISTDCVVLSAFLDLTTGDDGQTLDIGVAADGTTSADTIFDGVGVATTDQGTQINHVSGGTNGEMLPKLGATQYITGTADGDVSDLVGDLYITLVPMG